MKKHLLALLALTLSCVSVFGQTDPLQDIQSRVSAILSDVSATQSQIVGLNQTISTQQTTIANDQQTIEADGQVIASDTQQIQQLQSQLAAAQTGMFVSNIITQVTQAQTLPNWILAGGSAGNTGQKGSTGSGTFSPNPDGTATITITPNGPYYDSFWYRKAAGAITPVLKDFDYPVAFFLDSTNYPLSQQVEMESSWYNGTYRFQCAASIEMHTKSLRYYQPGTGWVATGITANIQADTWEPVELLCHSDPSTGKETYIGVYIDGKYHPLNITVQANLKATASPWVHTSVQIDSNSAGAPYEAKVRNIGLQIF